MKLFLILIVFFQLTIFSKELKSDGYYRYVQVLAIRDFKRAQKVMKKLDKYSYDYLVRDSVKKGERYYRIVVGPFLKNEIKEEQKKLEKLLYLGSSFILKYDTKPSSTVDIESLSEKKVVKKVIVNNSNKDYKKRIDHIVKLSFTKDDFRKNKTFVCKELNSLVKENYPPAILLLASNYIKGDECVKQNLNKAINYLNNMQKNSKNLPKSLEKFSKELLAETYIKTLKRENFRKAKNIFEDLLLYESNDNKYNIYIYKRLAYVEYFLNEYKYMNIWLEEAAKLGDVESQLNLGKNYIKALGVEENKEKSEYWLKKCMNKDKDCAETLGNLHLNLNLKTPPNLEKAFEYFKVASGLNSIQSQNLLNNKESIVNFYTLMQSEEIQYELVFEYLRRYVKNKEIKNMFITNINQNKSYYDTFISFSLEGEEKVAKIVFTKTVHNYWVVKDFKVSDSIMSLR